MAAVHCRLRRPEATSKELVGPVRHEEMPPTAALVSDPMPQHTVATSIGGR